MLFYWVNGIQTFNFGMFDIIIAFDNTYNMLPTKKTRNNKFMNIISKEKTRRKISALLYVFVLDDKNIKKKIILTKSKPISEIYSSMCFRIILGQNAKRLPNAGLISLRSTCLWSPGFIRLTMIPTTTHHIQAMAENHM